MSLHSVKAFLAEHAPDIHVIELEASTATVALAAEAHGVEPGRIAKTLSLRVGNDVVLLVTRGDVRVDNQKFKAQLAPVMRKAHDSSARGQGGTGTLGPAPGQRLGASGNSGGVTPGGSGAFVPFSTIASMV